jgi:hypothetical protein
MDRCSAMSVPVVQCRATSRAGKQCKNKAIPGGTVCRFSGGASPNVASKAAMRAEVESRYACRGHALGSRRYEGGPR